MIVGTAGHVDHGKTSLVRALTGIDTDRLVEEKARGITIELGFAYRPTDAADGPGEPIGFVDVPGHRRFVQTMIAGAAGIDVGLLVVAVDDGPMPQTREHLDILGWLGVPKLVVALSKIDRAGADRVDASIDAVIELLDRTPYRGSPIVPVSSVSGEGVDALMSTLLAHGDPGAIEATVVEGGAPVDGRSFRLAIDRAFVLQGIGLVVTGTCVAGRVALDDALVLLPGDLPARVRGIHAQNRPVAVAHAGLRVALNLVGRGVEKSSVHRGHWIVAPTAAVVSQRIDVLLAAATGHGRGDHPSSRAATTSPFDARGWRAVRFHAGAASHNARVIALDAALGAVLDATAGVVAGTLAQVVFDDPVHVLAGDRFVLRDATIDDAPASIAGGIVLDVDVPPRGRRSEARIAHLAVAARGDPQLTLADALDRTAKGIDLGRWNATHNTAFDADAVPARAIGASAAGVRSTSVRLFAPARWAAMLARVVEVLAADHARAPDTVGPGRDRLRRMAAPAFDAATFGALVDTLKADGRIAQAGAWLHLPEHRVDLSSDDRLRFARARPLLHAAATPNNPPRVRDVARALGEDESSIRSLFVRLASLGELYRVAHDHYFLPETIRDLATAAAALAATGGVTKAAPFRDRIGVGRKVAIQILEFFDRVGYTRRSGDDHRVVQPTLFDD